MKMHSVGKIASATGISVDTLRMWERRYGTPRPERLPSGHRRYTEDQLTHLRQVSEGLARGHRAGQLLTMPQEELAALLAEPVKTREDPDVQRWLALASSYDREGLREALSAALQSREPGRWLSEKVAPFLRTMGRLWADGDLDVRHEHFATELLNEELGKLRTRYEGERPQQSGPPMLLTTLPGEDHGLGIRMVALLCAYEGVPMRQIGVNTPLPDIAEAARELGSRAVLLSISLANGGVETDRVLVTLRDMLPEGCELVVGGEGARGPRRGPRRVRVMKSMSRLTSWLREIN